MRCICFALTAELLLFEKGEDVSLKRAKPGEPFAGISDNWRVFFTANLRGSGNKLSSAFLNRMILISLEPMDAVRSPCSVVVGCLDDWELPGWFVIVFMSMRALYWFPCVMSN